MSRIVPVILCGGVGSRLWPLSRKSLPKQFAQLLGKKSLFEAAVERVLMLKISQLLWSSHRVNTDFWLKNSYEIVGVLALFYLSQPVKTLLQPYLPRRIML